MKNQRNKARNVPNLRFPGFEGEWEEKRLGDFGKVSMCKRILKEQTDIVGDIPFYKIGTFGRQADSFISKELYEEYKSKYSFPKTGDILISAAGTIGRTVVYDGKPAYFQDSNIVWIDNTESLVKNIFLGLCYQNIKWNTENTTIARLYNNNLRTIKIYAPYSRDEQQKIASFLTVIDQRIQTQIKIIKEYQLLKQGLAQKLFSQKISFKDENGKDFYDWQEKKLGDICECITKGTTPTSIGFTFKKTGVNFIKAENISNDFYIDINTTAKISLECDDVLKRSKLQVNDILFSIAGTLGRTAVVKLKDLPANTNQALAILRLEQENNTSFVNYILNSFKIKKRIYQLLSIGAQPNLSLEQIKGFVMPYPCVEEQKKIANFLSAIDQKIEVENQILEQFKTQKQFLLQNLFI